MILLLLSCITGHMTKAGTKLCVTIDQTHFQCVPVFTRVCLVGLIFLKTTHATVCMITVSFPFQGHLTLPSAQPP